MTRLKDKRPNAIFNVRTLAGEATCRKLTRVRYRNQ
jgi:hypothetical protein